MDSRRGIKYQWKLFIPTIIITWVVILGMAWWQQYTIRELKREHLRSDLDLINSRIKDAFDNRHDAIDPFLRFIYKYYQDRRIENLDVSIYEDTVNIKTYGRPIYLSDVERERGDGITKTPYYEGEDESLKNFWYRSDTTSDKRYIILSVMPETEEVKSLAKTDFAMLAIMIGFGVFLTVISVLSARLLGKNLSILGAVAEKTANTSDFIPSQKFPNDEFGDITRQIVQLYNERCNAMLRQKREHEVAIHSIEEKAKAKRQLTSNINHELRTPIGVIKGYLDTILENPDMDADTRNRFLQKSLDHANRLVGLIADVSAITRLEEGGDLINTEELDYHDIIFTLANEVEDSGMMGKMKFEFSVPLDCKVRGNFNLLNGMIMNLLRNAVAYSKGTLCELFCSGEDDDFYHFVFRDNGTGVAEEHLPHLFERFYRVDSGRARKAGGTGLGLPIVQSTIQAHGGTIRIENVETGGLAFIFTLPKFKSDNR